MGKNKKNASLPATSEIQTQIEAKQAEIAALEAAAVEASAAEAAATKAKVDALPAHFGLATLGEVIKLIRKTGKVAGKRGKRSKVTDVHRETIKRMVAEEKTGAEMAKETGLSLPTVQSIKKELGLVKARA